MGEGAVLTVLLHGFWGGPADWNEILKRLPLGLEVWTPDFYEPGGLAPHHDIAGWCGHFIEEVHDRAAGGPVQIVGYSMGGRLLVNALTKKPDLAKRALVLSAQVFCQRDESGERARWERSWREKFLRESWEDLTRVWNAQEVFKGSNENINRRRDPILREMLGQSLINWSPTRHLYKDEALKTLPEAVDWAFGALDQKYLNVAQDLAKLPVRGQISIIENAGHRLPFDAAEWICAWIAQGSH